MSSPIHRTLLSRMPVLPPPRDQWPRGPPTTLHKTTTQRSAELTAAVLSTGSVDIDQGDPNGVTPLMISAVHGDSHIASILLEKGANVSVTSDGGFTALHFSSQRGHLVVTKMLLQAGCGVETADSKGYTPLHMAADRGHWQVMSALIEAGARPDTRLPSGSTPLFTAASKGYVAAIRVLVRAGANPTLSKMISPQEMHPSEMFHPSDQASAGATCGPLDMAAQEGHTGVVRELIQQCGIDGCGGASGGLFALRLAAQQGHVDVMILLTAAGVVDTGGALLGAVMGGCNEPVKFLLQQQRKRNPADVSRYVNILTNQGTTPLFSAVAFARASPRVVRWFIDAGANVSSVLEVKNSTGGVFFRGTPLDYATVTLLQKRVQGKNATEEQLNNLEGIRRLLLQIEAIHAASWLWTSNAPHPAAAREAETSASANSSASTPSTPLASTLPILRRRARRPHVLLAPLFRWVAI